MRKTVSLILVVLTCGIIIGLSLNASAQTSSSSIPSWVKKTAKIWSNGDISDSEFLKAIQWLIDQKILVVHQSVQTSTSISENKNIQTSNETSQMLTTNDIDPFWKIVSVKITENNPTYSAGPKIQWTQYLSKEGTPVTEVKLTKSVFYSNSYAAGGYTDIFNKMPGGGLQGNAIGGVSGVVTWKPADSMSVWEKCYGNVYREALEYQYSAVCVVGSTVVWGQVTGSDVNMQGDLAHFIEKVMLK